MIAAIAVAGNPRLGLGLATPPATGAFPEWWKEKPRAVGTRGKDQAQQGTVTMSETGYEILDRAAVFQGYFRVDRYRLRHRRFDGAWSPVLQREIFERGHAIAALLYDPVLDVVVLIEQFRVGPVAAGRPAWLLEVVAGVIEPGEALAEVVEREVTEEAGCTVLAMEKICSYLPSPGACSETVDLFCCRIDASNAGGVHGLAEEHEDIKVVVLPVAEAIARLDADQVNNSATIIALQWLARRHQDLRNRWLRA